MYDNIMKKRQNARGTLFLAAMLEVALVSLVVLNLAGCHSSPVLNSPLQNISDDVRQYVPRQRRDVINAAGCSDICPGDQTALSKCQEVVNEGKALPILPLEVFESPPALVCRSNSSLTVGWGLPGGRPSAPRPYTIWAELLAEYGPDTPCSQLVVHSSIVNESSYVKFSDLNETSKYYVRLTAYNCTTQLGESLITEELWTLSSTNFTLEPPVNITLEEVIYKDDSKGFEANLRWWPAEAHTCSYHLFVFSDEGLYYEWELEVPRDPFTKKIRELKYSKNYTFKMLSETLGNESEGSYYSYITASCLDTHKNLTVCPPDLPSNGSLSDEWKSTEFGEDQLDGGRRQFHTFDITVTWAEPRYKPDYYLVNLTSFENNNFSDFKIVSGIKTAVTFKSANVGLAYLVTIAAVSPGGRSSPIFLHRDIPKPLRGTGQNTGTLLWAILGPIGSFISIIGVAVFVYHRHQKLKLYKKRCRYFEELEQKAPKEADNGSSFTIPPEDDAFEVLPEKIILYEVLGEGAFGVVRKGWLPDHNREVAVKMLKDEPSAEEVKQFRQEMDMMKSVGSHPHIVSLVGCSTRPHATMMLVVEFCARGDLQNYLRWTWDVMTSRTSSKPLLSPNGNLSINLSDDENSNGQIKYSELLTTDNSDCNGSVIHSPHNLIVNRMYDLQQSIKDADEDRSNDITAVDLLSFSRQIAMGMEFLSSNRVVHRDLAARNVLVCSDKTVKIADFGLSRDIYQENMYKKTGSGKLPIKWMALESLTHQVYTTQSDVWSFGILLWEIVTLGGNPYPTVPTGRLHKLLQSGYRLECPINCSQDLYDLMLSCWQMRPKDRPGFSEIRLQLDKLLDGICSEEYLSLDIIEHKQNNQARIIATDQLSKGNENNQNELKTTDSERYVRPITVGRKPAILPVQPNHYISQPSSGNYPYSPGTIVSHRSFSNSIRHPSFNKLNKQTINISDSSFIMMDQDKLYADNRIPNEQLHNAINTISRNNSLGCRTPQHLKACAVTQFAGH